MKKGWIFLLIFVLCIGVLVYGYADTMTELKTHVNPAPQVGDEPGLAMAALEDALGKRSYPDDYAGMYIDGVVDRLTEGLYDGMSMAAREVHV